MTSNLDATGATRIEPAPDATALLRSTVPPRADLARLSASSKDLGASRRSSLVASLAFVGGPLPDRYEEGRVLGKGGMGVVVLAMDRDLARSVAVKKLETDGPAAEHLDRFLREAQVTAQLEHPGILPVHDLGIDEQGRFFYVMRLVRGDETLRRVIERLRAGDAATHTEFPFERRVKLIQKVAEILHYAHSKGVVHRDVKPENIMLGSFGEVYLVDWGLAKVAGAPAEERPATAATEPVSPAPGAPGSGSVTQAGQLLGTPLYMSPEQARGEPATPLSDIYGLSAVLYELLSLQHHLGERPRSVMELIPRILEGALTPAEKHYDKVNGRVPRHLSVICERGLAKRPEERHGSAHELDRALQGFIEGDGPVMCPVTAQLKLMTVYRRAVHRHPMAVATVTFFLPLLAALIYGGLRIHAALRG